MEAGIAYSLAQDVARWPIRCSLAHSKR
jgi:hypothetical protein